MPCTFNLPAASCPAGLRRQIPGRCDPERGSLTLELAILFPAMLTMIFLIVQAGVLFHSHNVALLAAQEGLRPASASGGSPGAGQNRAESVLAATAGDWLSDTAVAASRSATTARVVVTGRTMSLLPGLRGLVIHATATGPVERTTAP